MSQYDKLLKKPCFQTILLVCDTRENENKLTQKVCGLACRLLYFGQFGIGDIHIRHAVRLCVDHVLRQERVHMEPVLIQFRVHKTGITLIDLEQREFIQQHYPSECVKFIGLDPLKRTWEYANQNVAGSLLCSFFGFVTGNPNGYPERNLCHLLCEYEPNESAQVICDFTRRYLGISML